MRVSASRGKSVDDVELLHPVFAVEDGTGSASPFDQTIERHAVGDPENGSSGLNCDCTHQLTSFKQRWTDWTVLIKVRCVSATF